MKQQFSVNSRYLVVDVPYSKVLPAMNNEIMHNKILMAEA